MSAEWKEMRALVEVERAAGRACVVATLVRTEGSTYRKAGARAVFTLGGAHAGLLSGGCLEDDLALRAQSLFAGGGDDLVVYDLRSPDEIVFGLGLGCEGRMEISLSLLRSDEPSPFDNPPPFCWDVAVVGANADALPVVALFLSLGWNTRLLDRREGVLELFPSLGGLVKRVLVEETLAECAGGCDAILLMNHHFETDSACLATIAHCPHRSERLRYLGLLGPARRREKIFERVPEARALFPNILHAPAGLDLGGDSPDIIALSIAAEIQQVLAGRSAGALSQKQGNIHD